MCYPSISTDKKLKHQNRIIEKTSSDLTGLLEIFTYVFACLHIPIILISDVCVGVFECAVRKCVCVCVLLF